MTKPYEVLFGTGAVQTRWLFRTRFRGWRDDYEDDRWYQGSLNETLYLDGYGGDEALDRWADWGDYKAPTRGRVHDEWETLTEIAEPDLVIYDDVAWLTAA